MNETETKMNLDLCYRFYLITRQNILLLNKNLHKLTKTRIRKELTDVVEFMDKFYENDNKINPSFKRFFEEES